MSAADLVANDVANDLAAIVDAGVRSATVASTFDERLRAAAAHGCRELLALLPSSVARHYRWTAEEDAFGSGVEAWLQHEVLLALSAGWLPPGAPAVAIHVVDGLSGDAWTGIGERCRHVAVAADVVDAHVALLRAVIGMCAHAPAPYGDADRWCHTNLVGGGQVEALARENVGLAYAHTLRCLAWQGAYAAADALEEPHVWVPTAATPDQLAARARLGAKQWTAVERLVRAPLRFLAFRWVEPEPLPASEAPRTAFQLEALADIAAIVRLTRIEQHARVDGVEHAALQPAGSAAIGMAVSLQTTRMRRVHVGSAEAVRRLCLGGDDPPPAAIRRLGRIEAQMRCMWASALGLRPTGDDRGAHSLTFAFDEMQVLFGLAAALCLANLGGRVVLDRLCAAGWEEVADEWQRMVDGLDPEELEHELREAPHRGHAAG